MLRSKPLRRIKPHKKGKTLLKRKIGGNKRKRKSPLTKAKESLEAVQKELVIKVYGRDCYTCPQKNLKGMNCQLGHVPWPRSELSVQCVFTYTFTRIQCFRCNINCGGNGAKALKRMIAEGIDVDKMEAHNIATKGKTTSLNWFATKEQEYCILIQELKK